jgi:hypothetical protein
MLKHTVIGFIRIGSLVLATFFVAALVGSELVVVGAGLRLPHLDGLPPQQILLIALVLGPVPLWGLLVWRSLPAQVRRQSRIAQAGISMILLIGMLIACGFVAALVVLLRIWLRAPWLKQLTPMQVLSAGLVVGGVPYVIAIGLWRRHQNRTGL